MALLEPLAQFPQRQIRLPLLTAKTITFFSTQGCGSGGPVMSVQFGNGDGTSVETRDYELSFSPLPSSLQPRRRNIYQRKLRQLYRRG